MSLARPGRKQANVSVRMTWISFGALPCKKKKKLDDISRLDVVEIARVPDMLPSLFPSWFWLRTYQHPGNWQLIVGQKIAFKQTAHAYCSVADRSTSKKFSFYESGQKVACVNCQLKLRTHSNFMEKWHNYQECWLKLLGQITHRSGPSVTAVTWALPEDRSREFCEIKRASHRSTPPSDVGPLSS